MKGRKTKEKEEAVPKDGKKEGGQKVGRKKVEEIEGGRKKKRNKSR